MRPQDMRVAVAKACGWTPHEFKGIPYEWEDPNGVVWTDIPRYESDLNAMHEAEKTMTPYQWRIYVETLPTIVLGKEWFTWSYRYIGRMTIHATAPQRCEAFLRTLGLWVEEEK